MIRNEYRSIDSRYTVDLIPKCAILHDGTSPSTSVLSAVIPMTGTSNLLEPSFADAVVAIGQATDLSEQTRRHWVCSLRQIAKCLDRPVEVIPARWTSVRMPVAQLHHARVGVTAKTLANHRSNARAALRWFGKEHGVPVRGVPLSAAWAKLRDAIQNRGRRARLYGLMRYCSGRGIEPAAMTDAIVETYMHYRAETTALAFDNTARRSVARTWNACGGAIEGWPTQRLTEPPVKAMAGPAWEEFPEGLRRDVDAYLQGLGKIRRGLNGKRIRPCQSTTVRTRRAELVAVVRTAVRLGVPIESLTSLAALLHPDVVEPVIEAYWERNGEEPKVFTIALGWKLLSIAREIGGLNEADLGRLDEIRASLEHYRRFGLTEKNLKLVRLVLTEGIWSEVTSLPNILMREAHAAKDHAPIKAALTAQLAVAVAILSFAPVRLLNLANIELGQNLIKPGGLNAPYWLVFPHFDVKNRVDLNFQFDEALTKLIEEYVHEFRPVLLRRSNASWLFPGESGNRKTANMFSTQITERIEKATGLRITVHQFRHAAAAIYLKHHPGDYETVRRFLGHRNIQTTINFYCGLQTMQATEEFGKIIRRQIKFDTERRLRTSEVQLDGTAQYQELRR
jgi:integrase